MKNILDYMKPKRISADQSNATNVDLNEIVLPDSIYNNTERSNNKAQQKYHYKQTG